MRPFAVPTSRDRGWGKLAAEVEVHFVPGQHHSMVKEPHVRELAQHLEVCVRQVEAGGVSGGSKEMQQAMPGATIAY